MKVAIIPARGGSKRIPDKNIRDFLGQPMISYSIRAAKESDIFDRIIVSTDSERIAETARQCGAEVPFIRPPELSDDHAGTDVVIQHALRYLIETEHVNPELACCIYATAPFVRPEDLKKGGELLADNHIHNAFSVTSFAFPILRAQKISAAGMLEMQWPEHRMTRSQDLPEFYHDAGQFYWTRVVQFMEKADLYANAAPIILPRHLVQDIDTEEDWKQAELLYKVLDL